MATSPMTSLSRLTVLTTSTRMDLAVPLELTVAEFMSSLIETLGPEVADEAAAAGGFVLQRSGEIALDPSLTLRAAQVRDGDLLHLRMQAGQMPEVAYDDVLEAVASGVLTKSKRWTNEDTAKACSWFAALAVAFVVLESLLSGPSWVVPAAVTGGLSLVLVGLAVVLDRAFEQVSTSKVAAGFAITSGFAAGAMALGGDNPVWAFGSSQLLPASAAAVFVAVLCRALLSSGVAGFAAVIGTGLLTVAGSLAASVGDLDVTATAAFTAGIAPRAASTSVDAAAAASSSRGNDVEVPTRSQWSSE